MIPVQFLVHSPQTATYNIEPQDTQETKNIILFGINQGKNMAVISENV